jgi:hypothetical protein
MPHSVPYTVVKTPESEITWKTIQGIAILTLTAEIQIY